MGQERYLAIREVLEKRKEEVRDALFTVVRVPSVRGEKKPGAPFGEACAEALRVTAEVYAKYGYPSELFAESGYLLTSAGNPEGKTTIGSFAHADVVPTGDGWVFTSPFEPIEKEGFFIGRGISDNKAGIVMSLFAAEAIRELGLPLSSRFLFYTGSNEESGMADIRAFAREQKMPELSLVPDSSSPVCMGERGITRFWADAGTRFSDAVISVSGGKAFNAVLGDPKAVLRYSAELEEELRAFVKDDGMLTLEKENDTLILYAHGITRHAAVPEGAVHGILLLSDALRQCSALSEGDRAVFAAAAEYTKDCYGEGFGVAADDPAFGRLTCVNGMAETKDGILSLAFDSRYGTTTDETVFADTVIKKLTDAGWTYRLHESRPVYRFSEDDPGISALWEVYRYCTGDMEKKPFLSGGGTYARYLKKAYGMGNIPATPGFEVPEGHGGAHQPDEMISFEKLLDSTAITAEMLLVLDEIASQKQENS